MRRLFIEIFLTKAWFIYIKCTFNNNNYIITYLYLQSKFFHQLKKNYIKRFFSSPSLFLGEDKGERMLDGFPNRPAPTIPLLLDFLPETKSFAS